MLRQLPCTNLRDQEPMTLIHSFWI
jgi:hypothetical protein